MNVSELKFLIDVGVGKGIENYLREEGYDAKAVRDIDSRMEDENIIHTARGMRHLKSREKWPALSGLICSRRCKEKSYGSR